MASRLDRMTDLERGAYRAWRAGASDVRFGRCADCGRVQGDDGTALLVARQGRSRKWLCLACWDGTR